MVRQPSGAMICPNCNKLISVSEERCPFCGAWRPGMFGMTPALRKLFGGNFDFPHLVTIACVALYVLSLALEPQALFHPSSPFAILSPGINALDWLGMTYGEALGAGRWWTVLTAIYLLPQQLGPACFVATSTAVFFCMNAAKLPAYYGQGLLPPAIWHQAASLLPALAVGAVPPVSTIG